MKSTNKVFCFCSIFNSHLENKILNSNIQLIITNISKEKLHKDVQTSDSLFNITYENDVEKLKNIHQILSDENQKSNKVKIKL